MSAPTQNPGIGTGTTSGGYGGGAGASDAQQPNAPAQQQPAVNPMNPFHAPAAAMWHLYKTDPKAYLEAIRGTPDYQNALAANNGNVAAAQAMMKAEMVKKAALEMRSGGEVWMPDPSAPGRLPVDSHAQPLARHGLHARSGDSRNSRSTKYSGRSRRARQPARRDNGRRGRQ